MAAGGAVKPKPLRPIIPKRFIDDRIIAEPEFSFVTENNFADDATNVSPPLRHHEDAHVRTKCVKQWVDKTRPSKWAAFEHLSTADTLSPHYVSPSSSVICDEQLTVVDSSLEEEWRKREFDRAVNRLHTNFGYDLDESCERRKIEQKVARYRKAFLRGFFEARVRRLQANKCLYDKLHVNVDLVKQKYRQLVYHCRPCYATAEQRRELAAAGAAVDEIERPDGDDAAAAEKPDEEKSTIERTEVDDAAEISSVYSFVPERDHVILEDANEAPHLRGYGRDKRRGDKFDANVRLLNLDNWMSPDIREWIEERKLKERLEYDAKEDDDEERRMRQQPAIAGALSDDAALSENGGDGGVSGAPKITGGNADWKYEQIRGANELNNWLGPKMLNQKKERDFENFMKGGSLLDETTSSAAAAAAVTQEDGKVTAPVGQQPAPIDGRSNESEDTKTIVSETPSQYLMKELIESQSKEYYKLWYSTHDTYNTTPFLEARFQRLTKEILGRRQWLVYSSYLKNKSERKELDERTDNGNSSVIRE